MHFIAWEAKPETEVLISKMLESTFCSTDGVLHRLKMVLFCIMISCQLPHCPAAFSCQALDVTHGQAWQIQSRNQTAGGGARKWPDEAHQVPVGTHPHRTEREHLFQHLPAFLIGIYDHWCPSLMVVYVYAGCVMNRIVCLITIYVVHTVETGNLKFSYSFTIKLQTCQQSSHWCLISRWIV